MKSSGPQLIHSHAGNLIPIEGARRRREETAETAWARFTALRQRSKETLSISDGIAAAKAYADFLDLYVGRRA